MLLPDNKAVLSASRRVATEPPRRTPERTANPASASEVASLLGTYLSMRWNADGLSYIKWPTELTDGWETYSYSFQFESSRPLLLRVYPNRGGLSQARHEFAVMGHLRDLDFAVPEPLLLEEDCAYFGGPFLIRTEALGSSLFRTMLGRPWMLLTCPRQMAALQAELHRLPGKGFPACPAPLLERSLEQLADDIHAGGWQGLSRGLDWLLSHAPAPPRMPRILHLDFHPINIIQQADGTLALIDWSEADFGDPHADIGTTLVLAECTPAKSVSRLAQLRVAAGRPFFVRRYLRAYREHFPIDTKKLAYYRAWAALRRLCRYGKWLSAGEACGTCKPCAIQLIKRSDLASLETYFRRWTGVRVRLS
jgi:aminoglycoside phosphotransferase (APT) family kinase protein